MEKKEPEKVGYVVVPIYTPDQLAKVYKEKGYVPTAKKIKLTRSGGSVSFRGDLPVSKRG